MTPEDWKKADEYVSAMAKNMSKAQGKPDSEPKPLGSMPRCEATHPELGHQCGLRPDHVEYGIKHRIHYLSGFKEWAVERVQPEPQPPGKTAFDMRLGALQEKSFPAIVDKKTTMVVRLDDVKEWAFGERVQPEPAKPDMREVCQRCKRPRHMHYLDGDKADLCRPEGDERFVSPSTSVEPQVEPSRKIIEKCEQYWNEPNLCDAEVHAILEYIHAEARKLVAADSVSHLPTVSRDCRHCGHNIVYSLSAGGWVHMPDETKQCFLGEDSPDAEPSVSHPPLEQELVESAKALIDYIHGEEIDSPKSGLELAFRNKLSGRTYRFENALAAFVRERSKP